MKKPNWKLNTLTFKPEDLVLVKGVDYSIDRDFILAQAVQLASGSPDMVIVDINGDEISVAWKDNDACYQFAQFNRFCLIPV